MRMWLLAMAVAIAGAAALHLTGPVDLSKSIYTRPGFTWLSYLVGGFLFGVGMTLGSGCGNKTLVRIGGGNLKSVVVFVFLGISAYMTMKGLFGVWRVTWLDPVAIDLGARGIAGQDLPSAARRVRRRPQGRAHRRGRRGRARRCSPSCSRTAISAATSTTCSAAS